MNGRHETKADDYSKEYGSLRDEIRSADLSCQVIIATLATITGAILYKWPEKTDFVYACMVLQIVWLFGLMYIAERRFAITRISIYIRKYIEIKSRDFRYETITQEMKAKKGLMRPRLLPAPFTREIGIGAIVCISLPLFEIEKANFGSLIWWLSASFGIAIAVFGVVIWVEYFRFKKRLEDFFKPMAQ